MPERQYNIKQVAFIPGGNAGIGKIIAECLLKDGYSVAIGSRSQSTSHSERAVVGTRDSIAYFKCDIRKPLDISKTLAAIDLKWGSISTIINCVGPFRTIALGDETVSGWKDTFDSNLNSAFYLYQQAIPYLLKNKEPRILSFTIAKADQLLGRKRITSYYCAKAALIALTRAYAVNYANKGLTANIISLGDIREADDKKNKKDGSSKTDHRQWPQLDIPAQRLGNYQEASTLVQYLLRPEAQYINGALIDLSGAWAFA